MSVIAETDSPVISRLRYFSTLDGEIVQFLAFSRAETS